MNQFQENMLSDLVLAWLNEDDLATIVLCTRVDLQIRYHGLESEEIESMRPILEDIAHN